MGNQIQPNGLPPIGTTTATAIGRDYTLGATRSLESDAGRAERVARRYMRKFGRAGQAAASDLLKAAAFQRAAGVSVRTQAGMANRMNQQEEAEQSAVAQGQAAAEVEDAATTPVVNPNATPGAGRGRPVGSGRSSGEESSGNSPTVTQRAGSVLDSYFRSPAQRQEEEIRRKAKMKGAPGGSVSGSSSMPGSSYTSGKDETALA